MSEPFIGDIRMFAGNFAPVGYALCDGQLIGVSQNDALFSLLGTTYGGDGETTFGLPDMRGRAAMHYGMGPGLANRNLGQRFGEENVTLTVNQLPAHTHALQASTQGGQEGSPSGAVPAQTSANVYLRNPAAPTIFKLNSGTIPNAGGNQSHTNMMPYLCVSFIIALFGVYPSES